MNKIPNYRVWHKIEKRFVDLRNIDFELESIGYDCQGEANYYDVAKFDEIVFQQFTGLRDKNGKDIYEGDIIERKALTKTENHSYNYCHCYEVIYSTDEASYILKYGSGDDYVYLSDFIDNLEIIGNIFENSEPLKQ